jgi:hypothetical protein
MGKMGAKQKHSYNVKKRDRSVLKAREYHGINIMNGTLIRRTHKSHEFTVFRINGADRKMQKMENNE